MIEKPPTPRLRTLRVGDPLFWENPIGGGFGAVAYVIGGVAFQSGVFVRMEVPYALGLVRALEGLVSSGKVVDKLALRRVDYTNGGR